MSGRVILITGASSGFGFLTAKTLASNGHMVFAGMRQPEGRNSKAATDLRIHSKNASGNICVLDLDVTDDTSVKSAIDFVLKDDGTLDVAVNNAGIGAIGPAEGFDITQFRQIFDVNLFGVQRINRAILPIMRKKRSGLLIHISSGLGRIVAPFFSPYVASKFALEALVECYNYELNPLGITAIIIEPGTYETCFTKNWIPALDRERVNGYGSWLEICNKILKPLQLARDPRFKDKPNPQDVANAIANLVDMPAEKCPLRTVVNSKGGYGVNAINMVCAEIQEDFLNKIGINTRKSKFDKFR